MCFTFCCLDWFALAQWYIYFSECQYALIVFQTLSCVLSWISMNYICGVGIMDFPLWNLWLLITFCLINGLYMCQSCAMYPGSQNRTSGDSNTGFLLMSFCIMLIIKIYQLKFFPTVVQCRHSKHLERWSIVLPSSGNIGRSSGRSGYGPPCLLANQVQLGHYQGTSLAKWLCLLKTEEAIHFFVVHLWNSSQLIVQNFLVLSLNIFKAPILTN